MAEENLKILNKYGMYPNRDKILGRDDTRLIRKNQKLAILNQKRVAKGKLPLDSQGSELDLGEYKESVYREQIKTPRPQNQKKSMF